PSLAYMGEATSESGVGSFGVAYGIYNMAWGVGLLAGPSIGGYVYERSGFVTLGLAWAPLLAAVAGVLAIVRAPVRPASPVSYDGRGENNAAMRSSSVKDGIRAGGTSGS